MPGRNQNRHKVKITEHAKSRLASRCPYILPNNYSGVCTAARYKGTSINNLPDNQRKWVAKHFKFKYNTNQIRVYKNTIFIFAGDHSRTLITVYRLPKWLVEKSNDEHSDVV